MPHYTLTSPRPPHHLTCLARFATLDGALGHLLPVAEKTYRRLLMLMNVMTNNLNHTAGLNPKVANPRLSRICF